MITRVRWWVTVSHDHSHDHALLQLGGDGGADRCDRCDKWFVMKCHNRACWLTKTEGLYCRDGGGGADDVCRLFCHVVTNRCHTEGGLCLLVKDLIICSESGGEEYNRGLLFLFPECTVSNCSLFWWFIETSCVQPEACSVNPDLDSNISSLLTAGVLQSAPFNYTSNYK